MGLFDIPPKVVGVHGGGCMLLAVAGLLSLGTFVVLGWLFVERWF